MLRMLSEFRSSIYGVELIAYQPLIRDPISASAAAQYAFGIQIRL